MKGVSRTRNLPRLNREPLTDTEGEGTVTSKSYGRTSVSARHLLNAIAWGSVPGIVLAQASPFMTGMTSLQANILSWLTPVAIILVMVLGGMAMASRMSWGWCIGAIFGIAIAFGAPQIVTWIRGMFGV